MVAARMIGTVAVALAATLSSAAAQSTTVCNMQTITQQTAVVEQTCCAGETCNGGLPTECSHNCADVFTPFWASCGSYLAAMPGIGSFNSFNDLCQNGATATHANSQCDAANLVTILFFSCSNVNEGDLNTFCASDCMDQVSNFLGKCASTLAGGASAGVLAQAQSWLAMCPQGGGAGDSSCHSSACNGANEIECSGYADQARCAAHPGGTTCRWQACTSATHSPPPPPGHAPNPPAPPPVVVSKVGCTDETAINYDPSATLNGDGACIYNAPPPPPYTGPACSATASYGCHDQPSCEGAGLQWTSCTDLVQNQGCADCCQDMQGSCGQPCSAEHLYSCSTEALCSSVGATAQWHTRTENVYMPPTPPGSPPAPPPAPHVTGSCEQACAADHYYNCYTQAACEGVSKQWVPSTGTNAGAGAGTCSEMCDASHYTDCHSESECVAVNKQWTVERCCGTHCPPNGYERCEQTCAAQMHLISLVQIMRHQRDDAALSNLPASHLFRCEQTCTAQNTFACKTRYDCEGVGKQWVLSEQCNFGGESRLTAAIPAANPYCSCKLTRVFVQSPTPRHASRQR